MRWWRPTQMLSRPTCSAIQSGLQTVMSKDSPPGPHSRPARRAKGQTAECSLSLRDWLGTTCSLPQGTISCEVGAYPRRRRSRQFVPARRDHDEVGGASILRDLLRVPRMETRLIRGSRASLAMVQLLGSATSLSSRVASRCYPKLPGCYRDPCFSPGSAALNGLAHSN